MVVNDNFWFMYVLAIIHWNLLRFFPSTKADFCLQLSAAMVSMGIFFAIFINISDKISQNSQTRENFVVYA